MAQIYEYQDIDAHVILLFVHPACFLLSYKKKFVTNFVTLVRNFVIHVTKFVIRVRNFVTKTFL